MTNHWRGRKSVLLHKRRLPKGTLPLSGNVFWKVFAVWKVSFFKVLFSQRFFVVEKLWFCLKSFVFEKFLLFLRSLFVLKSFFVVEKFRKSRMGAKIAENAFFELSSPSYANLRYVNARVTTWKKKLGPKRISHTQKSACRKISWEAINLDFFFLFFHECKILPAWNNHPENKIACGELSAAGPRFSTGNFSDHGRVPSCYLLPFLQYSELYPNKRRAFVGLEKPNMWI